jgi:DNA topoisomerase-1
MNMQTPANTTVPAYATARAAGLRHTGDHQPGIVRLGKPGKFRYAMRTASPCATTTS